MEVQVSITRLDFEKNDLIQNETKLTSFNHHTGPFR